MNTQEAACLKAARLFSVHRGVSGSSPLNASLLLLSYRVCVSFLNLFSQFQFLFRFLCMQFLITSGVVIVAFLLGWLLIGGKVIMVKSNVCTLHVNTTTRRPLTRLLNLFMYLNNLVYFCLVRSSVG